MLSPNAITASRLVIAPLFFLAYFIPVWTGGGYQVAAILLVVLFILSEGSDILDGAVARRHGIITDLGKVLDPFADVIARMTYFICLVTGGYIPVWFLIIVTYRELGIVFLRLLVFRDGLALGARLWGKMKSLLYGVCAALGLLHVFLDRLGVPLDGWPEQSLRIAIVSTCGLAAILAIASFVDYLRVYREHRRGDGPAAPR